ncbi:MAG: protein-glutamate O-methyltransferase CheR [Lachnospiraceae bacterium]|nr:protein-glutamate O-methyltransferase CheR [Lachnospiraceae bacterium]
MYDYEAFKKDVYKLTNINLSLYKERQMKRRIESLRDREGFKDDYQGFVAAMKKDKDLLYKFVNHLTINVSEFYRNPGQWKQFEDQILPYLRENFGDRLKVWSAACSTGDEPYTLAMIMSKHLPKGSFKVYATDIDEAVLATAGMGIYSQKSVAGLPKDLLDKNFKKLADGKSYQISDEIKKCVEFKKHNLLEDRYFTGIHMIVCRNVIIYFTDEAKDRVYTGFNKAMMNKGILFIGSTEQIVNAKELGFDNFKSFFYVKP